PEKDFNEKAKSLAANMMSHDPARPINLLVAKAIAAKPPASLAELAKTYSDLLNEADRAWQQALKRAGEAKLPPAASLPDPAQEELRRVFHSPESPPQVPLAIFGDLALLPDRPAQAKLQEFRKAVEQW